MRQFKIRWYFLSDYQKGFKIKINKDIIYKSCLADEDVIGDLQLFDYCKELKHQCRISDLSYQTKMNFLYNNDKIYVGILNFKKYRIYKIESKNFRLKDYIVLTPQKTIYVFDSDIVPKMITPGFTTLILFSTESPITIIDNYYSNYDKVYERETLMYNK